MTLGKSLSLNKAETRAEVLVECCMKGVTALPLWAATCLLCLYVPHEGFSVGQGQGADGSGRYHSALGLLGLHKARCPVSLDSTQHFLSVLLPQVRDQA